LKPAAFEKKEDVLETQLESLGIKNTLARVYVSLLANGQSSASEVAKISGVHRVDIYKRLEEMAEIGLCNLRLGRPKSYTATDPAIVVESLLRDRTLALKDLENSKDKLISELRELEKSPASREQERVLSYELITGRRQIYSVTRRILKTSSHDVMRVISPNGLKRSFRHKLLEEYADCRKRGATVQIITDVTKLPKAIVRYCVSNFELRHSADSLMKILIVDQRLVMISGVLDDSNLSLDSPKARSLLSKDQNLAEMLSLIFRHLWESSKPVKSE
jgi:sugar-specific transcriptional regulator TrmB